jgi:hypothetical protein
MTPTALQTYNASLVRIGRLVAGRSAARVCAPPNEGYFSAKYGPSLIRQYGVKATTIHVRPTERDRLESYWRATLALAKRPEQRVDRRQDDDSPTEMAIPFLPAL